MEVPNIVPAGKKYNWIRIILVLLGIGLVIALAVWLYSITRVSWVRIKVLISQDAAGYSNPANVEKILLAGAKEIVYDPQLFEQARAYAKASGIELERVIANNALALSKQFNYIPDSPKPTNTISE